MLHEIHIRQPLCTAGEGSEWTLKRTRRLTSASSPDYAVLEASGQGIIVASDKPFKLVYDSESPPQTAASEALGEQKTEREREGLFMHM